MHSSLSIMSLKAEAMRVGVIFHGGKHVRIQPFLNVVQRGQVLYMYFRGVAGFQAGIQIFKANINIKKTLLNTRVFI